MPLKILNEFKEFILKGNMVDLAVGIVVGAAFTAFVNSLVKDLVMPPIGYVMSGIDFSQMDYQLAPAMEKGTRHPTLGYEVMKDTDRVAIRYGSFINACIALIIQGAVIFVVVKLINALRRKEEATPKTAPEPAKDIVLLTEIRDLLASPSPSSSPDDPTPPPPPPLRRVMNRHSE